MGGNVCYISQNSLTLFPHNVYDTENYQNTDALQPEDRNFPR